MIPGNYARDSDQTIHGMLDLPKASAQTEIRFTDATGNILHSKQLGAQASVLLVSVGKIYLQNCGCK